MKALNWVQLCLRNVQQLPRYVQRCFSKAALCRLSAVVHGNENLFPCENIRFPVNQKAAPKWVYSSRRILQVQNVKLLPSYPCCMLFLRMQSYSLSPWWVQLFLRNINLLPYEYRCSSGILCCFHMSTAVLQAAKLLPGEYNCFTGCKASQWWVQLFLRM